MYYHKPDPPPEPDENGDIECQCGTFWNVEVDSECPICAEFNETIIFNETEYAY